MASDTEYEDITPASASSQVHFGDGTQARKGKRKSARLAGAPPPDDWKATPLSKRRRVASAPPQAKEDGAQPEEEAIGEGAPQSGVANPSSVPVHDRIDMVSLSQMSQSIAEVRAHMAQSEERTARAIEDAVGRVSRVFQSQLKRMRTAEVSDSDERGAEQRERRAAKRSRAEMSEDLTVSRNSSLMDKMLRKLGPNERREVIPLEDDDGDAAPV